MAGGPTTTDLVIAAGQAGAFGFLAAGYKTPEAMAARSPPCGPRRPNPSGSTSSSPARPTVMARSSRVPGQLGPRLGDASWDDDGFDGKVAALLATARRHQLHLRLPAARGDPGLQDAGSAVVITVTSPAEAGWRRRRGRPALVQGYEAGAHRGTFGNDDTPGRDRDLLSLIGEAAAVTGLPQVAAGGIMGRARSGPCWPRAQPPSAGPPSCAARRAARTRCTRPRWPTRCTPPPP